MGKGIKKPQKRGRLRRPLFCGFLNFGFYAWQERIKIRDVSCLNCNEGSLASESPEGFGISKKAKTPRR